MDLEPSKNLKNTENSLRDLISTVLHEKYGEKWIDECGITQERIKKWEERREEEKKRQNTGSVDQRLLYYSDFYDIKKIITKNWDDVFLNIFNDKKTIEIFLSVLERYRDPDAHRRELFLHQKYLIAGLSEEIRIQITKYHSKKETGSDCFPKIESITDNLGNSYKIGDYLCDTKMTLRPGDELEFIISATDPEGLELEYSISTKPGTWNDFNDIKTRWKKENVIRYKVTDKNISKRFSVALSIRSPRQYHAEAEGYDDSIQFLYTVLPNP